MLRLPERSSPSALRRVAAGALVVMTFTIFAACGDDPVARRCSNIPAGGCPRSHGVACEDPACEAVYACRPGDVWELQERCPPRAPHEARGDAGAPIDAAAPELDASIDAPPGAFGGPGCAPLQAPDCMLGLAMACRAGCCGCEDLFVCEDRGWTLWGSCVDGGF